MTPHFTLWVKDIGCHTVTSNLSFLFTGWLGERVIDSPVRARISFCTSFYIKELLLPSLSLFLSTQAPSHLGLAAFHNTFPHTHTSSSLALSVYIYITILTTPKALLLLDQPQGIITTSRPTTPYHHDLYTHHGAHTWRLASIPKVVILSTLVVPTRSETIPFAFTVNNLASVQGADITEVFLGTIIGRTSHQNWIIVKIMPDDPAGMPMRNSPYGTSITRSLPSWVCGCGVRLHLSQPSRTMFISSGSWWSSLAISKGFHGRSRGVLRASLACTFSLR